MSIFEAMMLICFGAAWPVSIYKSYKSRKTGGKSFSFMVIIFIGYISGITHKLLFTPADPVRFLYFINAIMVATDIALYFRNKKIEKQN
jgi:hypothetical protein